MVKGEGDDSVSIGAMSELQNISCLPCARPSSSYVGGNHATDHGNNCREYGREHPWQGITIFMVTIAGVSMVPRKSSLSLTRCTEGYFSLVSLQLLPWIFACISPAIVTMDIPCNCYHGYSLQLLPWMFPAIVSTVLVLHLHWTSPLSLTSPPLILSPSPPLFLSPPSE